MTARVCYLEIDNGSSRKLWYMPSRHTLRVQFSKVLYRRYGELGYGCRLMEATCINSI